MNSGYTDDLVFTKQYDAPDSTSLNSKSVGSFAGSFLIKPTTYFSYYKIKTRISNELLGTNNKTRLVTHKGRIQVYYVKHFTIHKWSIISKLLFLG